MRNPPLDTVVRHAHQLAGPLAEPADAILVRRLAADRDSDAAAALVRRHGPMVLAVCRRSLGRAADADDAFQAAFLVLVRDACRIRVPGSVAGWLHGVAVRVCREVRVRETRRRAREQRAEHP
ncbi:MAG TPA: sigma factor, partial [Gemmataceae bacterium]|nr:sigma factor [Gemmataceae bacterium]